GNTEDWALGHVYATSQYTYWGALDKDTLEPFGGGAIQVDCSDGGGNEKRNGNSNMFMLKTYQLPDSNAAKVKFQVTTSGDGSGAKYKLSINIDGQYFILQDWNLPGNAAVKTIDLAELTGIADLGGKTVTVVFEARDSGRPVKDGAGEIVIFKSFVTEP
ncbi:MAG: hypothetical protein LBS99_03520, partial [Clostridiales bacterium]|nr:hypothetical protein [Clostridiales bacterium]